ncbi:LysE family translocator [Pacificibacter sp. AS14]|uniref:LysE family translocator n=1 Tax=Pacificibacter sp. AS14 TaxID=3135785 RepID=UPI0031809A31
MDPNASLLAFILTCAVIELTPGPNMAYLAVLAATEGRRAGLSAVAGVALGLLIVGLMAAFGLAAMIASSPVLFQILRWAGVVYLLWLAWDAWREEAPEDNEFSDGAARHFRRGLIVNLLNPKAGIFYIVMLPQFVDQTGDLVAQTVTLSVTFVLIATAIHTAIVILSDLARGIIGTQSRRKTLRRVMAVVLVVIAVWFAFET